MKKKKKSPYNVSTVIKNHIKGLGQFAIPMITFEEKKEKLSFHFFLILGPYEGNILLYICFRHCL